MQSQPLLYATPAPQTQSQIIGLLDGPFPYKLDPNFLANIEIFYGSGYGGPFAPTIPAYLLSSMVLFKVLDTRRDI